MLRRVSALLIAIALLAPVIPLRAQTAPLTGSIAFVSNRDGNEELYVMAADGTGAQRLTIAPLADTEPVWSPDGRQLAYVTEIAAGQNELAVVEVASGETMLLTDLRATVSHPVWSPDGMRIAFAADNAGNYEVMVVNANGSGLINATNNPADDRWPTWSPDNTRLAFQSDRDGNTDIFTTNLESGELARLTTDPGIDRAPVWSPDGMRIAFVTEREGNADVFVIDANGTNMVRLSSTPADDVDPVWSPDGIYVAYAAGQSMLTVIDANGYGERALTPGGEAVANPAWSPDGTWLVMASDRGGTWDLYVVNVESQAVFPLSDQPASDDTAPVWSATSDTDKPLPLATATQGVLPLATATPQQALPVATATPQIIPTITPMIVPTQAPPTTQAPPPTLTPQPIPPDLMLIYNPAIPSLYLVNVSGQPLNIAGLSFQGAGRVVQATVWSGTMSRSLFDFPAEGCLGLWSLDAPDQPQPPECGWRHGWWGSDNVVFWTSSTFTVYNNGVPVAVCDSNAGHCPVTLSNVVSVPSEPPQAAAPGQPPVASGSADVALIYTSTPSFYLVNISGRRINIAGLAFEGAGRRVDSSTWSGAMSGNLSDFPVDGCLGLWGLGIPIQPQPPECGWRHGWWESDDLVFWTSGSFTVTNNGSPLATCDSNTGCCEIDLPG